MRHHFCQLNLVVDFTSKGRQRFTEPIYEAEIISQWNHLYLQYTHQEQREQYFASYFESYVILNKEKRNG